MSTWKMFRFNGKRYIDTGECRRADGPKMAVHKFGLDLDGLTAVPTRKGFGYYCGRVDIYLPEQVAAGGKPEFRLFVID